MTNKTNTEPKAEFGFVILKQADGRIAVGNIEGLDTQREPGIDDIYASLSIVLRDITVQQQAAGLAALLQQLGAGPQQTKSGIVVPEPTQKFKKVQRVK